ncbi:hypothetical protein MAR_034698, partial [Mya arenaria]
KESIPGMPAQYLMRKNKRHDEWNAMVREIFQCVLAVLITKNDMATVERASRSLNTLPTNTQRSSRHQHETLF